MSAAQHHEPVDVASAPSTAPTERHLAELRAQPESNWIDVPAPSVQPRRSSSRRSPARLASAPRCGGPLHTSIGLLDVSVSG